MVFHWKVELYWFYRRFGQLFKIYVNCLYVKQCIGCGVRDMWHGKLHSFNGSKCTVVIAFRLKAFEWMDECVAVWQSKWRRKMCILAQWFSFPNLIMDSGQWTNAYVANIIGPKADFTTKHATTLHSKCILFINPQYCMSLILMCVCMCFNIDNYMCVDCCQPNECWRFSQLV